MRRRTNLAGVLLSPPSISIPLTLILASTFTTTRTGFLSPTRTSCPNASVIVAENNPVRRCFGRCDSKRVRVGVNPRSNNLEKKATKIQLFVFATSPDLKRTYLPHPIQELPIPSYCLHLNYSPISSPYSSRRRYCSPSRTLPIAPEYQ